MPACTSIAVTGQPQSCTSAAALTVPLRPQLLRSKMLGLTGNACTSPHLHPLREASTHLLGDTQQRARHRCCPTTHDATLSHHRKEALSTKAIDDINHSLLNNTAYGVLSGKRGCRPRRSSSGACRSSSLALLDTAEAALTRPDRCSSAPAKEAVASTVATLPSLSPMKVKAVADSASVSPGVTSTTAVAEVLPMSLCASNTPRRLSDALRCDLGQSSDSDCSIASPRMALSLYATEEELPVCIDPEGVQCCPLIDPECEEGVVTDAQINLSPFLNWKFVPYLSSQAKGQVRPTVVLDMDETLLHTSVMPMPDADAEIDALCPSDEAQGTGTSMTSGRYKLFVKYRPHLERFLLFCLDHFEVVIFTASKALYAQTVLRQLQKDFPSINIRLDGSSASGSAPASQRVGDEARVIELLHRDHCTPTNVGYAKDLHLLGRDLRRTILVDNNNVCGVFQPYNSVHVRDFARRRCAERVPEQQRMRVTQLCQLKGTAPASAMTAVEDADTSHLLGNLECTTSTYDWLDREDTVLLRLCAAGGLLHRLSQCENVPSFMQRTVCFSRRAHLSRLVRGSVSSGIRPFPGEG
ncbi:hypothetical protein LMJF_35_3520 [Leishmania major strain Friedlin]|uniref:Mitochondrial import inner membrane translocase subunit TIM50 n=1 Tax=Leishmania major TaxID=5664 RepID=E9AFH6_LEIMA|nr:hypothetical protein LMJF_35_3520 [Leishmania major strain Friedlin]CAG9582707.1 NLI_interacting_factor-like_phosphatase_-_putative [Leishmania major strain Friedlin]CBZ12980.1 hypothetical protein LMJF_35_3520 [Leishmania major strain Friedlin]|eukprot:XP_003722746.1 hypothetical protein LMJF_35_3520 [Leishmania major strain Friedlin]